MPPLLILAIAVAVVLGMILVLRLNAFVALITAAFVVSLLAPSDTANLRSEAEALGELAQAKAEEAAAITATDAASQERVARLRADAEAATKKADKNRQIAAELDDELKREPVYWSRQITRVASAFGSSAGKIGIPIAMAAVIGSCLLASGAADRVVRGMLSVFGQKRGATALAASGFTLSVPVFFDTVFFLLVPLAKSLFNKTGHSYLKYLLAIGAGGVVAHTLIPPTPGPLLVADQLKVDVGLMMLMGILIGLPLIGVGLLIAGWMDKTIVLKNPPTTKPEGAGPAAAPAGQDASAPAGAGPGPGLFVSALPIVLPVVLVASQTIIKQLAGDAPAGSGWAQAQSIASLLGHPSLALLLSAAVALTVYAVYKTPDREAFVKLVEEALMSGGVIVLITAAGGAFGAMLKAAQVGPAIQASFSTTTASGVGLLWLAFGIASLIKVSQGSGTVAMITASGMIAAMIDGQTLPYNPVYLAQAIGCGSLLGVWMNDSGFWLFCKMGGLTEGEGLKTWTVILAVIGVVAMLITVGLATVLPMAEVAAPVAP